MSKLFPATTIGVYGVSGCGKSRALSELQKIRPEWRCLEGSDVIENVLQKRGESLADFKAMDETFKTEIRNLAIGVLEEMCTGLTVVAGHASFPKNCSNISAPTFSDIFTDGDAQTYDAILYLDVDPDKVYQQREGDSNTGTRHREYLPVEVIAKWNQHEKEYLQGVCKKGDIYFALVRNVNEILMHVTDHILPPLILEAEMKSQQALKLAVQSIPSADVYLLFDGDRTLAPNDTSKLLFENTSTPSSSLKAIFQRYPSYTFQAFLEVAMLYDRLMPNAN